MCEVAVPMACCSLCGSTMTPTTSVPGAKESDGGQLTPPQQPRFSCHLSLRTTCRGRCRHDHLKVFTSLFRVGDALPTILLLWKLLPQLIMTSQSPNFSRKVSTFLFTPLFCYLLTGCNPTKPLQPQRCKVVNDNQLIYLGQV